MAWDRRSPVAPITVSRGHPTKSVARSAAAQDSGKAADKGLGTNAIAIASTDHFEKNSMQFQRGEFNLNATILAEA